VPFLKVRQRRSQTSDQIQFDAPCERAYRPAMLVRVGALLVVGFASLHSAQEAPPPDFEVVSIKRNVSGAVGNSMRTLPDGTEVMINSPVRAFILVAAPVEVTDVEGLPDWTTTEHYDVMAKPPAQSTREQRREMWRRMFADRFKLKAHVEQRQRDVFDLVLAREDGRLGPNIKPSTADCTPGALPPGPPASPLTVEEIQRSCRTMAGMNRVVSGGMTLAQLAGTVRGLVGGRVTDRTGLDGVFALELSFSPGLTAQPGALADDRPDVFTALQEQLGLNLVRGREMLPVLVIDSIERPSEN
jgi:uncharacterized protein (TIGR03435 family)